MLVVRSNSFMNLLYFLTYLSFLGVLFRREGKWSRKLPLCLCQDAFKDTVVTHWLLLSTQSPNDPVRIFLLLDTQNQYKQTTLNCYFLFIAEITSYHFASLPFLSRLFGQGISPSGGVFFYSRWLPEWLDRQEEKIKK